MEFVSRLLLCCCCRRPNLSCFRCCVDFVNRNNNYTWSSGTVLRMYGKNIDWRSQRSFRWSSTEGGGDDDEIGNGGKQTRISDEKVDGTNRLIDVNSSSVLDDFVSKLRIRKPNKRRTEKVELEGTFDGECERTLRERIERKDPLGAVDCLKRFSLQKKFPDRDTFLVLAAGCASIGDVDGVRCVRDVCAVSFPTELANQMNFRHCEAEAIWKGPLKRHREALILFTDLFKNHPLNRRKVTNMSNFCLRDVVNRNMSEVYPGALEFVVACYRISGTGVPAANLWRAAFCSDSFEARCFSNEVVNSSEGGEVFKRSVADKIPSVVKEARDEMRAETLQRLMELVLSLDMREHFVEVIGAYIEYLCEVDDVRGALEAFRYIRKSSVFIKGETAQQLMKLLVRHKRMVPFSLLNSKYNNHNGEKNNFIKF